MSDTPPAPQPAPAPTPPPDEESRFRQWLRKYVTEHQSKQLPNGQGGQQPSQSVAAPDLAAAVEAVIAKRERSQQSRKEIDDLKAGNATLAQRLEALEKNAKKRSPFSIFSGL